MILNEKCYTAEGIKNIMKYSLEETIFVPTALHQNFFEIFLGDCDNFLINNNNVKKTIFDVVGYFCLTTDRHKHILRFGYGNV